MNCLHLALWLAFGIAGAIIQCRYYARKQGFLTTPDCAELVIPLITGPAGLFAVIMTIRDMEKGGVIWRRKGGGK